MDGIEFLQAVKSDGNIKRVSVIVLTTSNEETDKIPSFDLGVVGYIVKRLITGNLSM